MAPRLSLSTVMEMRAEATAFVAMGYSQSDACRMVGLPLRLYQPSASSERINHLPTPEMIEAATQAIREGRAGLSAESVQRWRELAELRRHTHVLTAAQRG